MAERWYPGIDYMGCVNCTSKTPSGCGSYELPENLRVFFEGKAKKKARDCTKKCCC